MFKAYKVRLYPNKAQKVLIEKHFGCCRWVYNWALELNNKTYQETGKGMRRMELSSQLPILKQDAETAWLSEVSAQSLQQELSHLDDAFKNFFNNRKKFPRFKRRSSIQSYSVPQRVEVIGQKIQIQKLGLVPAKGLRDFVGKIKTTTVSKNATGQYFVSLLVESTDVPLTAPSINPSTTIGIDLGLTHFATLSTGEKIANPRFLKAGMKRLKWHQRKLSRKIYGSGKHRKQRRRFAVCHRKIANSRKDFLHKLSHRLTHESQVETICIEDLNVSGMLKNHNMAQSISDAGWREFRRQLTYKCAWYGKNLLVLGRFEPSSKMCSCGIVNHELMLKDRVWTCSVCGVTHDRDVLAANNIKRFTLST